jgi:hypothetical protein
MTSHREGMALLCLGEPQQARSPTWLPRRAICGTELEPVDETPGLLWTEPRLRR